MFLGIHINDFPAETVRYYMYKNTYKADFDF